MAKKAAKTTERIKGTPRLMPKPEEAPAQEPHEPKRTQTNPSEPERTIQTVEIILPLGEVGEQEYLSRHVESRLKTRKQQLAMKRLLRGLKQSGMTTADGRPVQRPGEAIRWLVEQISGSD